MIGNLRVPGVVAVAAAAALLLMTLGAISNAHAGGDGTPTPATSGTTTPAAGGGEQTVVPTITVAASTPTTAAAATTTPLAGGSEGLPTTGSGTDGGSAPNIGWLALIGAVGVGGAAAVFAGARRRPSAKQS